MDNLQWFKFSPSHWFMGRIQRCSEITQARFIRLCCLYWNKECIVSVDDAKIEVGESHFNELLALKIIEIEGTSISIKFLRDQFEECLELGNKRSIAAKARWEKANAMQLHTSAMQDYADKIRVDESRVEESRKEDIVDIHPLISWLLKTHPKIQRMKYPLKNDEADRLVKEFDKEFIKELFSEMENKTRLLKDYESANLTFRSWARYGQRYDKWKKEHGVVEIKMNT